MLIFFNYFIYIHLLVYNIQNISVVAEIGPLVEYISRSVEPPTPTRLKFRQLNREISSMRLALKNV
jgi:hypothetical protein